MATQTAPRMGLPAHVTDAATRLRRLDANHALRHMLEHHFSREEKGLFVDICEYRRLRVG